MSAESDRITAQRRLTSWKEIAAYLGRNERTVKRWEASRGLPVRRVAGATRGSVFAYAEEIDAWMHGDAAAGEVTEASSVHTPPSLPSGAEPASASTLQVRRSAFWAALPLVACVVAAFFYLGRIERSPPPPAPLNTRDSVAANFYRAGLHAWQTRAPSGLDRAIADFKQALARDPRFADAWVGLADAYNLEGEFTPGPRALAYPKAIEAARRAIALDPSLAGAHAALAFAEFYGAQDIRDAEGEFRRALTLDPQSAIAHHWHATVLMTVGNYRAAISEIEKAESLDAESTAIQADKGLILYCAGRRSDAIRLLQQLEEDTPTFASPHRYLSIIWLAEGNDPGYVHELKLVALARHDDGGRFLADSAAKGLAKAGRRGMLHALLDAQKTLFNANQSSAYSLAETCALLDDGVCARSYLQISFARHEGEDIGLAADHLFARFRSEHWFAELLTRTGQS